MFTEILLSLICLGYFGVQSRINIIKTQTGTIELTTTFSKTPRDHCKLSPGCQYFQNLTIYAKGNVLGTKFNDASNRRTDTKVPIYTWPFYENDSGDVIDVEIILYEYHPMVGKSFLTQLQLSNVLQGNLQERTILSSNNDVECVISNFRVNCSKDFFGGYCQRFCNTNSTLYNCDSQGQRKCNNDREGPYCEVYNFCKDKPCPPHSTCRSLPNMDRECICNDGSRGNRCYLFYDPCEKIQCFNEGKCVAIDRDHNGACECPDEFKGKDCSLRQDECFSKSSHSYEKIASFVKNNMTKYCKNNGICIENEDFEESPFKCQCSLLYKGVDCGDLKILESIGVIVGLISLLTLIIFLLSLIVKYYKRMNNNILPNRIRTENKLVSRTLRQEFMR